MPRPPGAKNKPKAAVRAMQQFMREKLTHRFKTSGLKDRPLNANLEGVVAHGGEAPSTSSSLQAPADPEATDADSFTRDTDRDTDAELQELPFLNESHSVTSSAHSLANSSVDVSVNHSVDLSTSIQPPNNSLCGELLDAGAGLLVRLSDIAVQSLIDAEGGGKYVRTVLQSMEIGERGYAIRALSAGLEDRLQLLGDKEGAEVDAVIMFLIQLQPALLVPPLVDDFLSLLPYTSGERKKLLCRALGLAQEGEATDDRSLANLSPHQDLNLRSLRSEHDPVVATFQPLNMSISNPDAPQLLFPMEAARPDGGSNNSLLNLENTLEDAYTVGEGGAEEEDESENEDVSAHRERGSRQGGSGKGKGREQASSRDDPSPRKTTTSRSTMPIWLGAHYEERKRTWNKEIAADKDRFPACYRRGDFWDRAPAPWFAMYRDIRPNPSVLYRPDIFIWIPDVFFSSTLQCPFCEKGHLNIYETWAPHLRRFVDFERTCYVAGRRYRCRSCRHSCMSWNAKLLASLPVSLSMEFPVHFSHRSGISRGVLDIMRRCFQLGLGPRPFSNILQVCARLQHDRRHVQYLNVVFRRANVVPGKFIPYSKFDDTDGYAGFIPSPGWLTEMYSRSIEADLVDMVQHIAMLPFRIGAIDHSYKVIQKLMQHLGEKIFGGLFAGNNDYFECRLLDLVASKSQTHVEDALRKLSQSLTLYGHEQPQAIWTDNVRADKPFLEKVFPSLLIDVDAVTEHSDLEDLTLPEAWRAIVYNTFDSIDRAMNSIIGELSDAMHGLDGKDGLVVGFDMEWPVDLTTGVYGVTCLIQVAYDGVVYLLQIGQLKNKAHLPSGLIGVLQNERITKVGRHIAADLRRLSADFSIQDVPFKGVAELSKLCKERNIIRDARKGLAELVAIVLHRHLPKPDHVRISPNWNTKSLSNEQINYAALDAYACLAVYEAVVKIPAPGPVPQNAAPGLRVALRSADRTSILAYGMLAALPMTAEGHRGRYDDINVTRTKTRVLVEVESVLVPAAKAPVHHQRFLHSFGDVPFLLVCDRRHLQTALHDHRANEQDRTVPPLPPRAHELPMPDHSTRTIDSSMTEIEDDVVEDAVQELVTIALQDVPNTTEQTNTVTDEEHLRFYSRVFGDAWHVMHRIKVPMHHGLRVPFVRAFRDAMFRFVEEDKRKVEVVLEKRGLTWDKQLSRNARYLCKRARRIIPPPNELLPAISDVFKIFGPLKDAKTGDPLFKSSTWDDAQNVLENIRRGWVSDPPGIPLYFEAGRDQDGLTIWRCIRGTNATEGGIHQNLRHRISPYNASPRFGSNLLLDYTVTHNLNVGTLTRTGNTWRRHYSIPLMNELSSLLDATQLQMEPGSPDYLNGWINGRLYEPTEEVFGILPIPADTCDALRFRPYDPVHAPKHHKYLAQRQGTEQAVLPLATSAEKKLFNTLMRTHPKFMTTSEPKWDDCAAIWTEYCDGKEIYYKLGENLRAYYLKWVEYQNASNSLSRSNDAQSAVLATRSIGPTAIHPPGAHSKPNLPTSGLLQLALTTSDPVEPAVASILHNDEMELNVHGKRHALLAEDVADTSPNSGSSKRRRDSTVHHSIDSASGSGITAVVHRARRDRPKKSSRIRRCRICHDDQICLGRGPGGAAACDRGRRWYEEHGLEFPSNVAPS